MRNERRPPTAPDQDSKRYVSERRPSKRIIINADDFGFSRHVTDAIVDCHTNGIVTSTTVMANMPAVEYAARLAPEHPRLGVGVHVNLTEGEPVAGVERVRGLLGEDGLFPGNAAQTKRLWRAKALYPAIREEIRAQVQKVVDLGIQPTHCDSHHGINRMPLVRQALIEVLHEFSIPCARTTLSWHRRVPGEGSPAVWLDWARRLARRGPTIVLHAWSHYRFRAQGIRTPTWKAARHMGIPNAGSPRDQLIATLAAAPSDRTSEILLHPGGFGSDEDPSPWRRRTWAEDTPVCKDPVVQSYIEENAIELIDFRDL